MQLKRFITLIVLVVACCINGYAGGGEKKKKVIVGAKWRIDSMLLGATRHTIIEGFKPGNSKSNPSYYQKYAADHPPYFQTNAPGLGSSADIEAALENENKKQRVTFPPGSEASLPEIYIRIWYAGTKHILPLKPKVVKAAAVDPKNPVETVSSSPEEAILTEVYENLKARSNQQIPADANALLIDLRVVTQKTEVDEKTIAEAIVIDQIEINPGNPNISTQEVVARVSDIKEATTVYALTNFKDVDVFNKATQVLVGQIGGILRGEIKHELLANTIPNERLKHTAWFKKLWEAAMSTESSATSGAVENGYLYSLTNAISQGELDDLHLTLQGVKEKIGECYLVITDFRIRNTSKEAEVEAYVQELLRKGIKGLLRIDIGLEKFSYEWMDAKRQNDCFNSLLAWWLINAQSEQMISRLLKFYISIGGTMPVPPASISQYREQYPLWRFYKQLPDVPVFFGEKVHNPDAKDYDPELSQLYSNYIRKTPSIAIDKLEELLTGLKWRGGYMDLTKYSVDRIEFAFACGIVNAMPELLEVLKKSPATGDNIYKLLCEQNMEQIIDNMASILKFANKLNAAAEQMGGYYNMALMVADEMNPCQKAYFAGNLFFNIVLMYLEVAQAGRVGSLAKFINELGNLDPMALVTAILMRPVGAFAGYAIEKGIGLWHLGKYVARYIYLNGRIQLQLALKEGENFMEKLSELNWKTVANMFEPTEWVEAIGPDGEPVQIAWLSVGDKGNGGKKGGSGKRPKITETFPDKKAPEGSTSGSKMPEVDEAEGTIGMAEDPESGKKEPVVVRKTRTVTEMVEVARDDKNAIGKATKEKLKLKLIKGDKEVGYLEREFGQRSDGKPIIRYTFYDLSGNEIATGFFAYETKIIGQNKYASLDGTFFYKAGTEKKLPGAIAIAIQDVDLFCSSIPETADFQSVNLFVDKDLLKSPELKEEKKYLSGETDKEGPIAQKLGRKYKKGDIEEDYDEDQDLWNFRKREEKPALEALEPGKRRRVKVQEPSLIGKGGVNHVMNIIDAETGEVVGQISRSLHLNATWLGSQTFLQYEFIDAAGIFGAKGKTITFPANLTLQTSTGAEYNLSPALHILAVDMNLPKALTDQYAGIGGIMFEDGYKLLDEKAGVDVIMGTWKKDIEYVDYGGESLNLTEYRKSLKELGSKEEAANKTPTGKWVQRVLKEENTSYQTKIFRERKNEEGDLWEVVVLFIKREERTIASEMPWVRSFESFAPNKMTIDLGFSTPSAFLEKEIRQSAGKLVKFEHPDGFTHTYTYINPNKIEKKIEATLIQQGNAKGTLVITGLVEAEVDGLSKIIIWDMLDSYQNKVQRIEMAFSKKSMDWRKEFLYTDEIIKQTWVAQQIEAKWGFRLKAESIKDYPEYVTVQFSISEPGRELHINGGSPDPTQRITTTVDENSLGLMGKTVEMTVKDEAGQILGKLVRNTKKNGRKLEYSFIDLAGNSQSLNSYFSLETVEEINADAALKKLHFDIPEGNYIKGDIIIPIDINQRYARLGKHMFDDATVYFTQYYNARGFVSHWISGADDLYKDYGNQSVNFGKYVAARKSGASPSEAALQTATGQWAKDKFPEVKVLDESDESIYALFQNPKHDENMHAAPVNLPEPSKLRLIEDPSSAPEWGVAKTPFKFVDEEGKPLCQFRRGDLSNNQLNYFYFDETGEISAVTTPLVLNYPGRINRSLVNGRMQTTLTVPSPLWISKQSKRIADYISEGTLDNKLFKDAFSFWDKFYNKIDKIQKTFSKASPDWRSDLPVEEAILETEISKFLNSRYKWDIRITNYSGDEVTVEYILR